MSLSLIWENDLSLVYGNEQISQSERGLFCIVDSQQMGVSWRVCTDHNVQQLQNKISAAQTIIESHSWQIWHLCWTHFLCWFKCMQPPEQSIQCVFDAWKIPQECMQTVIVPICKNKNGNISDAGNYRPVSLATIDSKLFENFILSCISPLLATTDNQFGFKPKHGTDMCIFLLKLKWMFSMYQ